MAEKARVRAEMLARRESVPADLRAPADAALHQNLTALVRGQRAGRLAGYVPLVGEPGGPGLLAVLAGIAETLLLPVLADDLDLDWAEYQGSGSLRLARLGLREPATPRLGPAAVTSADLVVVPAVAVDRTGIRLGRGGGSYDRALARVRTSALVVALLYDAELIDELPSAPHDRRVGAVVLPGAGVVYLPTSAGRAHGH